MPQIAGKMQMEEELDTQFRLVEKDLSKAVYSATHLAKKDTLEWALYAGRTAQVDSLTLELTALNHHHMDVE